MVLAVSQTRMAQLYALYSIYFKKMNNNLYIIHWHDIHSNDEWLSRDEAVAWAKYQWGEEYQTVGEIVDETEGYYLIAGTYGEDVYSEVVMIPKGSVTKLEKIRG